ncbi:MAG: sigma-70 family RNA polymerase sigma factor [Acidobacteria bacterium]|nr:sigma-70 family RNA polymerase sigma factor [Acidobacteriota bacterium]
MNLTGTHEFELHVINRVLKGDAEAYAELIKRYEKSIVNYIYRYVMDYEESLDISQEVFVKAYYALDKYDKNYRFSTWLYRIARNAAIDNLRKKQLNLRSIDEPQRTRNEELTFQVPSPDVTPEDKLCNFEFVQHFNEAVQSLPLEYREVITLRHINHCSYQEIAEVCDIPIGTVKNRIFRGRELLRKKLEGKL